MDAYLQLCNFSSTEQDSTWSWYGSWWALYNSAWLLGCFRRNFLYFTTWNGCSESDIQTHYQ